MAKFPKAKFDERVTPEALARDYHIGTHRRLPNTSGWSLALDIPKGNLRRSGDRAIRILGYYLTKLPSKSELKRLFSCDVNSILDMSEAMGIGIWVFEQRKLDQASPKAQSLKEQEARNAELDPSTDPSLTVDFWESEAWRLAVMATVFVYEIAPDFAAELFAVAPDKVVQLAQEVEAQGFINWVNSCTPEVRAYVRPLKLLDKVTNRRKTVVLDWSEDADTF